MEFAVFLPVVLTLYWIIPNRHVKIQNALLILASYTFYGWWDWRFLSLIVISSAVDYLVGLGLSKQDNPRKRRLLLLTSIFVNIGFLGFFKYFSFFVDSFVDAFLLCGTKLNPTSLNIILPVGISFYTFQTLSYTIDVYRKKVAPTYDVLAFFAFVSFFPQLVAGPIERATNLLPQFYKTRKFEYEGAVDGLRQILWGLFKKIVVADNCAEYADTIFANYTDYSGSLLLLGALYFAFQIYCDFSGYSDIAIGTARLFGFSLMRNFAFPYFSRDVAEFWRRWHISLSTWFRDYVYIPLGGSRGGTWTKIRNTFAIFLVSGFWHGANWTFVIWGFVNACYFLPLLLLNRNRTHLNTVAQGALFPSISEFCQITTTFLLTLIAWVFFRAQSLDHAFGYISKIFQASLFSVPSFHREHLPWIAFLLIAEWFQRDKPHVLHFQNTNLPRIVRWAFYSFLIFLIGMYMQTEQTPFIYFQF